MSLKIVFCCCSFVCFDGNGMDSDGREVSETYSDRFSCLKLLDIWQED